MASLFEELLEPQRLEVAADSRWWLLALALGGTVAGGCVIWLLIRRLGAMGAGLSRSEAVLAFPLALAAFILPSVFDLARGEPLPSGSPLWNALIQGSIALVCIFALANHPWREGDEERGGWHRAHARQLAWVPLLCLAAFPVMQLAMFASVLLHNLLGAPIEAQGVVEDLRSQRSPMWIFSWYLMAVVAAPLMEEFVFRVALFGGTRRLLAGLSNAEGWRHPGSILALVASVFAFVVAHGVWGWTVGILPLTLLSLVLTALYAHTKSIWPGVLYHAIHNAFVVTMQFYVLR
jgi:membrane protease YdiL (CAAX protease family)